MFHLIAELQNGVNNTLVKYLTGLEIVGIIGF